MLLSVNENDFTLIEVSLKFIALGPTDKKSSLGQIIAWCQTGAKPLAVAMMAKLSDAYTGQ